jgi:hypothetical protein
MACITNFRARQGTSSYASGAITWSNSTKASDVAFTANINELKNITVTYPEMEYEKVDFLGTSAQTVGANTENLGASTGIVAGRFQNQAIQDTAVGMWQVSGTQVVNGNPQFEDVLGLGAGQAITGGNTRYKIGSFETDGSSSRSKIGSYRLFLNNGTQEECIVVSNVRVKLGELKPTGADGHYEREFELVALAKDGAIEFKN